MVKAYESEEEWNQACEIDGESDLLNELREIAKRKHEIWEKGAVDFGRATFHWRNDSSAREYQSLENRVREIKRELFGEYALEI
jgi:hypothetical protein